MSFRRFVIIMMIFLFLAACGGGGGGGHSGNDVVYEVSSYTTSTVDVTYLDENGDSLFDDDVTINTSSWTYSFNAPSGTNLSVAATLNGLIDDQISVRIYVNDEIATQNSINVHGQTVTATYTIP